MRFAFPCIPLVLLSSLAATACGRGADARGADTRDPGSEPAPTPAGTYRIAICKRGCEAADTARAEAWGVLVLMDSPLTLAASGDSGDAGFGSGRARRGSTTPNACYGLDRPDSARTYAGITSAGQTWWAADARGDVRVQLYRSPDASYVATLRASSGGALRGHGASRGTGVVETDWPDDSISAVRIGAADASLCIPSARSMAPREAWGTEARPRREGRPAGAPDSSTRPPAARP